MAWNVLHCNSKGSIWSNVNITFVLLSLWKLYKANSILRFSSPDVYTLKCFIHNLKFSTNVKNSYIPVFPDSVKKFLNNDKLTAFSLLLSTAYSFIWTNKTKGHKSFRSFSSLARPGQIVRNVDVEGSDAYYMKRYREFAKVSPFPLVPWNFTDYPGFSRRCIPSCILFSSIETRDNHGKSQACCWSLISQIERRLIRVNKDRHISKHHRTWTLDVKITGRRWKFSWKKKLCNSSRARF